ncbi:hypothetical protein Val02_64920 [Virgisporangium aliadipatigenens]|uniref:Uncharacterized protein n=1 Tax=Virgisporangium aliadipatigenens TaxID=741659 RepID=A0A8J3YQJ5_9ACTN|nr:hypothetical protein [Virgisporangium aliadipatigenens]GIJ49606.1 hypothetical protein Val02_64920 [Virgisporangium aliadipatigenens]
MALVSLELDDDAPIGAIVAVIEIVDERLTTATRTVIRSGRPTQVELAAGHYLARGWLPSHDLVEARIAVRSARSTESVRLKRRTATASAPGARGGAGVTGWIRGWEQSHSGWTADLPPEAERSAGWSVTARAARTGSGRSLGIQVGGGGAAPLIGLVPRDASVRIAYRGGDPPLWHLAPTPATEATLLGYLDQGDLIAAGVIVAEILADTETTRLLDLATGYYLLRTGSPRAESWVETLAWNDPDSADTALLNACWLMQSRETTSSEISAEILRAADNGIPLVAYGLRLLFEHLSALDTTTARAFRERLGAYLRASVPAPLTTFTAADPNAPDRDVSTGLEPDRPFTTFTLGLPSTGATPSDSSPPAAYARPMRREPLIQALRSLESFGLGEATGRFEADVDAVTVVARVTASTAPGAFDIELLLRDRTSNAGGFAGTTLQLRTGTITYHLARVDERGRCLFPGIPSGDWEFAVLRESRQRFQAPTFVLPMPISEAAHTSNTPDAKALLRVRSPSGQLMFVLRQGSRATYAVEVVNRRGNDPALPGVVEIEYDMPDGSTRLALVPMAASRSATTSSLIRLDGFVPGQGSWRGSEIQPLSVLTDLPEEEITAAVRMAASPETRNSWLVIARHLPQLDAAVRAGLPSDFPETGPS